MDIPATKKRSQPKYLVKSLLANHMEDRMLERKLADLDWISNRRINELNSLTNGMKLEIKQNQRHLANKKRKNITTISKEISDLVQQSSRSMDVDLMTKLLLSEYNRLSEQTANNVFSTTAKEYPAHHRIIQEEPFSFHQATGSAVPDLSKIIELIGAVKSLYANIALVNKTDDQKVKPDTKNIFEIKEQPSNDSILYTDGLCTLLRRKISKMKRRESISVVEEQKDPLQIMLSRRRAFSLSLPVADSKTKGSTNSRSNLPYLIRQRNIFRKTHGKCDNCELCPASNQKDMYAQTKLCIEYKRYQNIKKKIDLFLAEVSPKT